MIYRSSKAKDSAVSPVVGVIMMVAITVVLAAVLGQFVFGLVDTLKEPPQAGVTFSSEKNATNPGKYDVTVIASSMPNADRVEVRPSVGTGMVLNEPGDSETQAYDEGATLTIVTVLDGQQVVTQVYQVGQ